MTYSSMAILDCFRGPKFGRGPTPWVVEYNADDETGKILRFILRGLDEMRPVTGGYLRSHPEVSCDLSGGKPGRPVVDIGVVSSLHKATSHLSGVVEEEVVARAVQRLLGD